MNKANLVADAGLYEEVLRTEPNNATAQRCPLLGVKRTALSRRFYSLPPAQGITFWSSSRSATLAALYAAWFVEKELKPWCLAAKEKSGFYGEYQRRTGISFIAAAATFFVVLFLTAMLFICLH